MFQLLVERREMIVVALTLVGFAVAGCSGVEGQRSNESPLLPTATLPAERNTPTAPSETSEPTEEKSPSSPEPGKTRQSKEPEVSVSPAEITAGMSVNVKVHDFPAGTDLNIGMGRVNSEYDVIAQAQTDADGSLATKIEVPDFVSPGDAWVVVVGVEGAQTQAISDALRVKGGQKASILLNRHSAKVGDTVTINGVGFPAESAVELGMGRVNSEYDLVDSVETETDGRFQAEFTIPDFVDSEDKWVIVATANDNRIKAISEEIIITE